MLGPAGLGGGGALASVADNVLNMEVLYQQPCHQVCHIVRTLDVLLLVSLGGWPLPHHPASIFHV